MPPELIRNPRHSPIAAALSRVPAAWAKALGWLALVWAAALLLTGGQWIAMAHQWLTVSAYQHILFVPPIIGWLVWNRRAALTQIEPRGWWPGLVLMLGALAVWLVGSLISLNIVAQAGAVMLLQAATLTLLGPRAGAVLLFPLAFAVFLVPFGEEIVPPLQMLTAEIVIALTHLSGIEAHIDGVFIDTPAGLFEVAAACAGVQFVVAMVTLGVLAAKIGMERWPRRIALMALCVVVPILANGVRAWGTIAIAQVIGAERAGGVDHIIYGWVFFAVVVALVLALAWRWFDRDPDAEALSAARLADHALVAKLERHSLSATTLAPLLISAIVLVGLWSALATSSAANVPVLRAPPVSGWTQVADPATPEWRPAGKAASAILLTRYRDQEGRFVDLYLAAYTGDADPTVGEEGAVPPETPWRHVEAAPAPDAMRGDRLMAYGRDRRVAWTAFVTNGTSQANPLLFRISTLGDRLRLRPEPRWIVIVSAPEPGAVPALQAFVSAADGPAALVQRSQTR